MFTEDPDSDAATTIAPERVISLGGPRFVSPREWKAGTGKIGGVRSFLRMAFRVVDAETYGLLYQRVLAQIDRLRPRLMVIDVTPGYAIDAAMTRGIPFVLSVPYPVSHVYSGRLPWDYPAPFSGLPRRMTPRQKIENVLFKLRLTGAIMTEPSVYRLTRGVRKLGITSWTFDLSRYADASVATFGYSVFGLEYPFPRVPPNLRMLGAMVPRRPPRDSGLSGWLAEHKSIVYIGFGTLMPWSAGQVGAIVEVAKRLEDHQILWKLPAEEQKLLPDEPLPANLRIEDWIPSQLEVLAHPHVKVFFNHGGANSVHEGLYFGTPLLVMPFWMDCHDLAVRAVDSGAALTVGEIAPAPVLAGLRRLLTDGGFRERACHWGQQLRAAGGVSATADLVEVFAR